MARRLTEQEQQNLAGYDMAVEHYLPAAEYALAQEGIDVGDMYGLDALAAFYMASVAEHVEHGRDLLIANAANSEKARLGEVLMLNNLVLGWHLSVLFGIPPGIMNNVELSASPPPSEDGRYFTPTASLANIASAILYNPQNVDVMGLKEPRYWVEEALGILPTVQDMDPAPWDTMAQQAGFGPRAQQPY